MLCDHGGPEEVAKRSVLGTRSTTPVARKRSRFDPRVLPVSQRPLQPRRWTTVRRCKSIRKRRCEAEPLEISPPGRSPASRYRPSTGSSHPRRFLGWRTLVGHAQGQRQGSSSPRSSSSGVLHGSKRRSRSADVGRSKRALTRTRSTAKRRLPPWRVPPPPLALIGVAEKSVSTRRVKWWFNEAGAKPRSSAN